ncbi:transglycosylase domain-containing protein [Maribacter cobaltidurans]|uniref:Penicillin-binding protein n=1 Tax=Maribacter cobaltidurans TaxID=1178778 RepID=A0A223V7C4_9FLAO|nr:transglycosylase domain-containing protein [Maribacter cobaltidurans]ASV31324.1 penicillin-binding protein [Maribacter cobaltidurans]GGD83228.1 penicillin-binding protein 1A [Maribacter cobaltidurans]
MNKVKYYLNKIKPPILRYTLVGLLGLLFIFIFFVGSIYVGFWGNIPNKKELSNFQYQVASEVFSSDSTLIGKYYLNDRQPISFDQFPEHLLQALISIEDERFYEHSGVDYLSLFRVGLKTILMGDDSSGGGSTISQQLAKNLYPRRDRKKTNIVVDKIKEMFIASRLEDIYDKNEILTHYLNTVSFGDNAFGIESAALKFFNTHTKNLSIPQAATLVGMLKATYGYNPRIFPAKSKQRRNLVLYTMEKNGFISDEQYGSLKESELTLDYRDYDYSSGIAPYFREEVRKQLLDWTKKKNETGSDYNIYTSGLKIYTTLNFKMQQLAEETMVEHMSKLQDDFEKSYGKNAPWISNQNLIKKIARRSGAYQNLKKRGLEDEEIFDSLSRTKRKMTLKTWGEDREMEVSVLDSIQHYMKFLNTGSLSIDPTTGEVLSWIGGINFKQFKYDHISQSKRQVGSTFKPIVYTAALEEGIEPCTYFSAQEVEYENLKGWSPSNSGDKDEAYLNYSMEQGLSNSVNTVAVKVLEQTGIDKVISQAKDMGIEEKLPREPSLALGTGEIKMLDLAKAYTTYINEGHWVEPFLIKAIATKNDSVLAEFKSKRSTKKAFTIENGQIMIEMMKSTINSGTASRIHSTYKISNDIAGKTGTTQNNKDAWFVALTPKMIHMTWVGLDNHEIGFRNTTLGQGANAALPMFALLMQKMNKAKEFTTITKARFPAPSEHVREMLDCEPVKRDGFFKRLFKNPNKKKTKKFKDQT